MAAVMTTLSRKSNSAFLATCRTGLRPSTKGQLAPISAGAFFISLNLEQCSQQRSCTGVEVGERGWNAL
jgi:hypothetical protein